MAEDTSKQTTRRKGTKREPLSSGSTQPTGATKPSFMSKAFKPKPKVE
ncbi:MAG: cell division protein FtsQ, partial [Atopobium sp.]|nr:cell division protein FtsQ [Atopobium sp.]